MVRATIFLKLVVCLFLLLLFFGYTDTSFAQRAVPACRTEPIGDSWKWSDGCTTEEIAFECNKPNPGQDVIAACSRSLVASPGFKLPSLGDVLTFVIRLIFIGAGILALFYLIRGAFMYITSGGDAKKTESAQHMIQAAVVGVILLVVVFAIVATLEQVVFAGRLGLGVTVPLTIPGLIE